jgi:8-oxo-dGTP pyrophosphatase MutT (NUDIX family)
MKYQEVIKITRQKLSAHQPQRLRIPDFIPAAVVILFFNVDGEAHILFTKRTDSVEHHKGQVSFPGGAMEANDASLQETALRETYEEVGIPPHLMNVIGQLDDFPTISDFLVTPFVATMPYPYPGNINAEEVAELLEVPLDLFLTDKYFRMEERRLGDQTYPLYFYHFKHTVIWGVTGYIINRFIDLVFDYNPAPESIQRASNTIDLMKANILRRGMFK